MMRLAGRPAQDLFGTVTSKKRPVIRLPNQLAAQRVDERAEHVPGLVKLAGGQPGRGQPGGAVQRAQQVAAPGGEPEQRRALVMPGGPARWRTLC
jgi:hypothetical protein